MNQTKSKLSGATFISIFTSLTGLSIDDMLKEVTAETEEEQLLAQFENIKKMDKHIRSAHHNDIT